MNSLLFTSKLCILLLTLVYNLPLILCSASSNATLWYKSCGNTFTCGSKLSGIGYPFWGGDRPKDCGYPGLELSCTNNNVTIIKIMGHKYQVLGINKTDQTLNILRDDYATSLKGLCLKDYVNTTLDYSLFEYTPSSQNLTLLYGCPSTESEYGSGGYNSAPFTCSVNGSNNSAGLVIIGSVGPAVKGCYTSVVVQVMSSLAVESQAGNLGIEGVIVKGFEVRYNVETQACDNCTKVNGRCGYEASVNTTSCICANGTFGFDSCGYNETTSASSSNEKVRKRKTRLLIGVSMGIVVLLALLGGCVLIFKKCKRNPQNESVEDSLKNYASLVPKRYVYKYIKKITKSYKEKLGEGGYGTVFKGNLKDGRVVAVKVWKQSKGDGQDFLNEVLSISRTSHVNVVPLLGFCFEGHKRALIYEFMPNGSLEKFIQGRSFSENNQSLSAQKLFEIGVGVARGLEYLHRGCNTRIVHFDIKPHNILLDAEFIPKISDFGLAKSCQQKESLISMSGARGTIGYIAPEVFFRTYGGVSHKSDVYSFGMMVLEMVGCKNKVNDNVGNSSEMYFPQWIYNQLELGAITIDCERILNKEEKELERKMLLVGLWCIQTNPMSRPSMSRVVEMLEGKVELLQVPPMPTLCSPPRQQNIDDDSASSTTYTTTLNY